MDMRKYWNLWPVFALACGMVAFASCSDDDEDNGDGGNGGAGGSGGLPSLVGVGITDPVTEIGYEYDGAISGVSRFAYADGRMVSGFTENDDLDFTIAYSPFQIHAFDDYGYEENYFDIQTNGYGSITYAKITYRDGADGDSSDGEELYINAEYDGNNQLTRYVEGVYMVDEEGEYRGEDIAELVWENGNVVSVAISYAEYENGEQYVDEPYVTTFDYGNSPVANSGIYVYDMIIDLDFMSFAGCYGRPTNAIPVSAYNDGVSTRYTVEKDDKGRIVSCRIEEIRNNYSDETVCYYGYADSPLNLASSSAQVKKRAAGKSDRTRRLIERVKAMKQSKN